MQFPYAVPHYLVLDLFPSGDTSFNEYFADTGKTESVREDLDQLFFVVSDTAAASAEGVSRTQYNRITDLVGEIDTSLYIMDNQGCRYRLADFFHGIFEFLTVLCFFDGLCCGTDQGVRCFLFRSLFLRVPSQRFSPAWPPRVGRTLSGFSFWMSCSTTSTVSGSM